MQNENKFEIDKAIFGEVMILKQQVFNFDGKKGLLFKNKLDKKENTFSFSDRCEETNQQWKPKMPAKRIYCDPKFLLSIEKKKVKLENMPEQIDFNHDHFEKVNFIKENTIKPKKQTSYVKRRMLRTIDFPQSYTHSTISTIQNEKNGKVPHFNFNLNHLIKQRKKMNSVSEVRTARQKGSSFSHHIYLKPNKEHKSYERKEVFEDPLSTIQNLKLQCSKIVNHSQTISFTPLKSKGYTARYERKAYLNQLESF